MLYESLMPLFLLNGLVNGAPVVISSLRFGLDTFNIFTRKVVSTVLFVRSCNLSFLIVEFFKFDQT